MAVVDGKAGFAAWTGCARPTSIFPALRIPGADGGGEDRGLAEAEPVVVSGGLRRTRGGASRAAAGARTVRVSPGPGLGPDAGREGPGAAGTRPARWRRKIWEINHQPAQPHVIVRAAPPAGHAAAAGRIGRQPTIDPHHHRGRAWAGRNSPKTRRLTAPGWRVHDVCATVFVQAATTLAGVGGSHERGGRLQLQGAAARWCASARPRRLRAASGDPVGPPSGSAKAVRPCWKRTSRPPAAPSSAEALPVSARSAHRRLAPGIRDADLAYIPPEGTCRHQGFAPASPRPRCSAWSFDAGGRSRQRHHLAALARAFPGNHRAQPLRLVPASGGGAGRRDEELRSGSRRARDLAKCSNVTVKIGRPRHAAAGLRPGPSSEALAELAARVERCIEPSAPRAEGVRGPPGAQAATATCWGWKTRSRGSVAVASAEEKADLFWRSASVLLPAALVEPLGATPRYIRVPRRWAAVLLRRRQGRSPAARVQSSPLGFPRERRRTGEAAAAQGSASASAHSRRTAPCWPGPGERHRCACGRGRTRPHRPAPPPPTPRSTEGPLHLHKGAGLPRPAQGSSDRAARPRAPRGRSEGPRQHRRLGGLGQRAAAQRTDRRFPAAGGVLESGAASVLGSDGCHARLSTPRSPARATASRDPCGGARTGRCRAARPPRRPPRSRACPCATTASARRRGQLADGGRRAQRPAPPRA